MAVLAGEMVGQQAIDQQSTGLTVLQDRLGDLYLFSA
jgi:hypothetical protein